MKQLTKSEIAKVFQIDKELVDKCTSVYKIIENRERAFVNKVLKPWLTELVNKENLSNGQKKTSCKANKG